MPQVPASEADGKSTQLKLGPGGFGNKGGRGILKGQGVNTGIELQDSG